MRSWLLRVALIAVVAAATREAEPRVGAEQDSVWGPLPEATRYWEATATRENDGWRAEWDCSSFGCRVVLTDIRPSAPAIIVPWRSPRNIIAAVFWDVPAQAFAIVDCETGFTWDRFATGRYGERGPFQIHPIHIGLIVSMGYIWDDMYEVEPNARVARALYDRSGWAPWSCSAWR